ARAPDAASSPPPAPVPDFASSLSSDLASAAAVPGPLTPPRGAIGVPCGGVARAGAAAGGGTGMPGTPRPSDAIVAANSGLGVSSGGCGATSPGRGAPATRGSGGGAAGRLRRPRKWLTLSTGSQSSNPSLQQWSSASNGCWPTQRCASASEYG